MQGNSKKTENTKKNKGKLQKVSDKLKNLFFLEKG